MGLFSSYEPTPFQSRFHQSVATHRIMVGGYGQGKTTAGLMEAVRLARSRPDACVGVVTPVGGLWSRLGEMVPEECEGSPGLSFILPEGGRILILITPKGQGESLKGTVLSAAFIDTPEHYTDRDLEIVYSRVRQEGLGHRIWMASECPRLERWETGPYDLEVIEPRAVDNPYLPKGRTR